MELSHKDERSLALLHISDLHGDGNSLERVLTWAFAHKDAFDDIVATGDLAYKKFSDGMTFWTAVKGSRHVLTCVGNHDVFDSLQTCMAYDKITVADAAARYIDAFCDAWGPIDHTPGTTWYAKDYPSSHARLIVLDCIIYHGVNSSAQAAAQNIWLESTLEDALGKDRAVVIAAHYPLARKSMVDCSWTPATQRFAYDPFLAQDITRRVQTFVDSGGAFACYLCGHSHCDGAHTLPNHPEQFALSVPCTSDAEEQTVLGDMDRSQPSNRDSFNIVTVDASRHLVRVARIGANCDYLSRRRTTLVWDYARHRLVDAN